MINKRLRTTLTILLALFVGGMAWGQASSDAYRNSQSELNGTARAQALSGAIGAVGADASAVGINPSGVALYSNNAFSATFEAGRGIVNSVWRNAKDAFTTNDKWALGTVNNISSVATLLPRSSGLPFNVNFGFSYNRDYDYKRSYGLINSNPKFGLTDYMAFEASRIAAPFDSKTITPIVDLGLAARYIEAFTDNAKGVPQGKEFRYRTLFSATEIGHRPDEGKYVLFTPAASNLQVQESGYRNSYDLSLGAGYADMVYFGATLNIGSQSTSRVATYHEDFYNKYNNQDFKSNLTYETGLVTAGSSIGLNLGVLAAISDYGRVGISYLLPQYATYNEKYWASASSYNDAYRRNEYKDYKTGELESSYSALLPGRLNLSAMAFLGPYGFITYDYQYRNLGSAKLYNPKSMVELSESSFIKEDFGAEHTHRVGLEVRPVKKLSVRAGYSYTGNPMKAEQFREEPEMGLTYHYVPSGYITDFVLPRSYQTASAGLGYFITDRTSIDVAYVYGWRSEQVYPFSGSSAKDMVVSEGYLDENRQFVPKEERRDVHMEVIGGQLKTDKHKFVATLSLRF